jgi:hypothetical protein
MIRMWFIVVLLALPYIAKAGEPELAQRRAMNYVVVSPEGPDDGGDFGPHTPGTKTSGIQEAFDFAKANRKDMYIAGGTMPDKFKNGVVYHIQETIRIPWFQDFRLDGGEYVINLDKNTGDAIVIDSQMSCRFKFGLIVAPTEGAVVRIKPESKGPDDFIVTTASTFEFNAIVGGGSVFNDGKKAPIGSGLVLDASNGPIVYNKFYLTEMIACDVGLQLTCGPEGNEKSAVAMNRFEIPFLHLCKTHMQIGDERARVAGNIFDVVVDGGGVPESIGMRLFGKDNVFTLRLVNIPEGNGVIFEGPAERNRIEMVYPASGYTNNAAKPNNVIVPQVSAGFGIETPSVPASGEALVNRTPFNVEVLVTAAGEVTGWTLTDTNGASQDFAASWSVGQRFPLAPGEAITVTYTAAPTWRWRSR